MLSCTSTLTQKRWLKVIIYASIALLVMYFLVLSNLSTKQLLDFDNHLSNPNQSNVYNRQPSPSRNNIFTPYKLPLYHKLVKTPNGNKIETYDFALSLISIILLVLLGGLVAGLTLGLMSLDETNLHILSNSGDIKQRKYANKIKPIRKNGHLLLVTLLLTNTLINETMPILIDSIFGGGLIAILISTILILIFGEIIPQAVCARYGLRIGAMFAIPVRILIYLLYVVAYPIAKLLDLALGENHGISYRRPELKELVAFHEAGRGGSLSRDEVTIIRGALDLSEKSSKDIMTELRYVFMVEIDCSLDSITLRDIIRAGHSRIPVYEKSRDNIKGLLLAKTLILVDPNKSTPVRDIKLYPLPRVDESKSIFDLLNMFQEGSSHMCLIVKSPLSEDSRNDSTLLSSSLKLRSSKNSSDNSNKPVEEKPIGIVTLEDVLEELIQEEIVDETDVFIDVSNRIKVIRKPNSIRKSSPLLNPKNNVIESKTTSTALTGALNKSNSNKLKKQIYKNMIVSKSKRKNKRLISYENNEESGKDLNGNKLIIRSNSECISPTSRKSHGKARLSPKNNNSNTRPGTQADQEFSNSRNNNSDNEEKEMTSKSLPASSSSSTNTNNATAASFKSK